MPLFNVLAQEEPKVLFDNQSAIERDLVLSLLNSIKLRRKDSQGIILGVGHKECKVDEVVGVAEFGEKLKVCR